MLISVSEHAKKHNLLPKKSLGQNFLFDMNICRKIVKSSSDITDKTIVEIGPGPGGLTRAILEHNPKLLYVVETDPRAINLLQEIAKMHKNLIVLHLDALKVKIADITKEKVFIISNLPYNIGTLLLVRWMHEINTIDELTLMLQKEVVDRIVSENNSKAYGRISVLVQSLCYAHKCFDVSKEVFSPQPKVTSSVINIKVKKEIMPLDLLLKLEGVTNLAFNQRRKMIKTSLKNIVLPKHIDNSKRAENLSVEDFINIAKGL